MNIITGYRGEPHITAQEDRDINLGVVGKSTSDLYVLDVGQQLDADIVSANEIRIRDGVLVMQGCAASIDYGTYDSLTISNGSQGMERIDIIAAQYEKDADTSVENVSLVVVEGTPDAADPQPPTLTGGDLQGGDTLIQMPLYYVNIDGVSIDSIDAQFTMVDSAFSNSIAEATKATWATITGNDGSLNDISSWLCPVSVPVTLTANTGTVTSVSAYKFGPFTVVAFNVKNSTATAAGSNIFSGTLSIKPLFLCDTVRYNGSQVCITQINTSGNMTCRAIAETWTSNVAVEGSIILYTG